MVRKRVTLLLFTGILSPSDTRADELTRWSVFQPEREFSQCGASPNNLARSYCYDEIDKKLRRAIRWADGYVNKQLVEKAKLPDSFSEYGGKYAVEAVTTLRATANGYSRLIASDCKVASWGMRGGSGQGLLAQTCEIGHRIRLFERYKIFF
jgi:hypothetical protein